MFCERRFPTQMLYRISRVLVDREAFLYLFSAAGAICASPFLPEYGNYYQPLIDNAQC